MSAAKKLIILGTSLIVASPLILTVFTVATGFAQDVHNSVLDPEHPLAKGYAGGYETSWLTRVALGCILLGLAGVLSILCGIVVFFISRARAQMKLKAERDRLEYFRG